MTTVRVGIPRAIQFYEHFPLWRTFFEELGAKIVVSPATNREIVSSGAAVVADATCLPVKIYAGHVIWLRDNGDTDFVFSPAIWNLEAGAFHCAKLKGLPDIMRATVPDCPPLLIADIDPWHRRLGTRDAFLKVGRQFTRNPWRIQKAWAAACRADGVYRSHIVGEQLTYPEALAKLYGPEWLPSRHSARRSTGPVVGLLGHPYCLYDDYINHDLLAHLDDLGIRIRTSEMVSPESARRGIDRTTRQTRWYYDPWISGAAGHFLFEAETAGLIAVLAFGCGPDSTMVETATRRSRAVGHPCMSLILDEHGSATGMTTRLEAFAEMLSRQGCAGGRKPQDADRCGARSPARPEPRTALPSAHGPIVGIPSMGTSAVTLKALFEGIGAQVEMGPPASKRTLILGAGCTPEFMCTPYKQLIGNMIEMLEAGADTLVYVDGLDQCRTSSYPQMMEDALCDLGYRFQFAIFTEIFKGGIFAMPRYLRRFAPEVTWRDILREMGLAIARMQAIDDVERRVQYLRPREAPGGGVEKVWEEALGRLGNARGMEDLKRAKADILLKLDKIPRDPDARPVQVGLTGEIFAVLDAFYNQDIERELSRAGAEVHRTLMISNWMRAEMILAALGLPFDQAVARAARPYLRASVSGEGWATLGNTALYGDRGFDGMVQLMPFTCMPNVTALNILPRVSRDHDIPVLPFIFDEQSAHAGMRARIEAFVDLLYRRRERREASKQRAPRSNIRGPAVPVEALCAGCRTVNECAQERGPNIGAMCREMAEAGKDRRLR